MIIKNINDLLSLSSKRRIDVFWILTLLITTLAVYLPGIDNDFVNWDDNVYISSNNLIHSISKDNLQSIFSESFEGHYHPLTLLSFAIDYHFFKNEAWYYHLVNILLHLINTILVFILARRIFPEIAIAGITALLFGIHPMHVESVAWITARKDVLFTFFFLLSLITYVNYLHKKKLSLYFFTLLLFLFSVLSKSQAISLSITLFAIDYILGRKLLSKAVVIEKLPFLLISLIFGIITIYAQNQTGYSGKSDMLLPFHQRVAYACYGFTMYIYKLIIPLQLSAYYPYPLTDAGNIPLYVYLSAIPVIMTGGLLILFCKRSKEVCFGMLFFIINIFLMLKLFPVANFIIADRYTYIASIGLFIIIGILFTGSRLWKLKWRRFLMTVYILYFIFLGILAYNRVEIWQNSFTLLDDILEKYPRVVTALNARGDARAEAGDMQGALLDFTRAAEYDPVNERAYRNRALVKYKLGDFKGSVVDNNTAIAINPYDGIAFLNRGLAKEKLGDINGAFDDYNKSAEIDPLLAEAYNNRGNLLVVTANLQEALQEFDRAISTKPDFMKAYANRAKLKNKMGNFEAALADIARAIELGFDHPDLYYEQGYALYNLKDFGEAIKCFDRTVLMKKNYPQAYLYRGYSRNNLHDYAGTIADLDIALKAAPANSIALAIRGLAKINSGNNESGCRDLHAAEKLGLEQAKTEIEKHCND